MAEEDSCAKYLAEALAARGIPHAFVERRVRRRGVEGPWLHFELGERHYYFRVGVLMQTLDPDDPEGFYAYNDGAIKVANDKSLTRLILGLAGISVPRGAAFRYEDAAAARAAFEALGGPACVKPEKGRHGDCVAVGLKTRAEFEAAFARAGKKWRRVIVEESLGGVGVRMIYVAPQVVAARLSLPPAVNGDGKQPLAALIAAENERRTSGQVVGLQPIVVDEVLVDALRRKGLSLQDVPALGVRVVLTEVANCARGAGFIICGSELHPSYKEVVERACNTVPGLKLAGVDLQVLDLGQPAAPGNHWVLELNGAPGFDTFHLPAVGKPVDVAGAIVEKLLRDG